MDNNKRFCDVCGAPLEGGERFCIACGTPIGETLPVSPTSGYPPQPTQPYSYPPPVKKNHTLAIVLGVVGGLFVLVLAVVLVFLPFGRGKVTSGTPQNNSSSVAVPDGQSSGTVVASPADPSKKLTIDDFAGVWTISTVDSEPLGGEEYLEIWVEGGQVKFVYQGYNLSFNLSLLGDGSLQGEARTGGGEIFLAQGVLYDNGSTLQVYMPAP